MEPSQSKKNRGVALWLSAGIVMLIIQVLLGGITRLTGSGLSITEWQPLLGSIPPLNEEEWNSAFEKYKLIGQYQQLNSHFTLSDFKAIYFWEWLHRNWARLIGFVFVIPFIYFWWKGKLRGEMKHHMIILFLLGILQGVIGWIMVKSGLNVESVYVNPLKLAIHFIAAMVLLAYLLWFAMKIVAREERKYSAFLKRLNLVILVLLFIQLFYGGIMAGSHAALAAPTWPDINRQFLPDAMFSHHNFWSGMLVNLITIQFIHRGLAYLLFVLIVIWTVRVHHVQASALLFRIRFLPLILVALQAALGIIALLNVLNETNLIFNLLHQLMGMVLLLVLVLTLFLSSGKSIAESYR